MKGLCEGGEARRAWRQIQRIASSHQSNIGASPFSYSPPKQDKKDIQWNFTSVTGNVSMSISPDNKWVSTVTV